MTEVVFQQHLPPSRRRTANVYRLSRVPVSERTLDEIVLSVGLVRSKTAVVTKDQYSVSYCDQQHELTLFRASGAMLYFERSRWQVDDGKSSVKFSDDQAEAIARSKIAELGLAKRGEFRLLRVTQLNVAVVDTTSGRGKHRTIDKGVIFQRLVDGVPVLGPGGKLIVYLNSTREMTGVVSVWRPIQGVQRSASLVSQSDAERLLVSQFKDRDTRVTVTKCDYGYYELGPLAPQRYLQPAYVFKTSATSSGPGKFRANVEHVVGAATRPIGEITPRIAPPLAQKLRR